MRRRNLPGRPSLDCSFAYVSGPAYGLLLDEWGVSWRKELTAESELGTLLAKTYAIRPRPPGRPSVLAAARRRFIESPIVVPGPGKAEGSVVSGEGWKLELAPGFRLTSGARAGDQVVTKE